MKEKRISFCQGKGSLTHNNREFIAENIDRNRIKDNVTFIRQDLGEAYNRLFAESTERYNAKQKRNDRKIHGTYYESLFHQKPSNTVVTAADKRKSFYEDVVQIGKMDDSGVGTEDAELVAECLKEYMKDFQSKNPNFYVFNAVLHMDEATPHLHIDYIPIAHHKRGQDIQNGIAKALEEMGYGTGKQAIARWRAAEVEVLNKICLEHGIEPLPPEKSRGSLEVAEYKEQMKKVDELTSIEKEKRSAVAYLESEMDEKADKLLEINAELDAVEKKQVKLIDIDSVETKKSVFGGKVTVSKEDYETLSDLAKKHVTSTKQTKKLKSENAELRKKNAELKKLAEKQNAELEKYRQPATFSRENLSKSNQRISKQEDLTRKLKRAMIVIEKYGLKAEYETTKFNSTNRFELE